MSSELGAGAGAGAGVCSCCRRGYDAAERAPKLLACRHHFCLSCARGVLARGHEIYCPHCWRRTELPAGRAETLPALPARRTLEDDCRAWWPGATALARETRQLRDEAGRLRARRREAVLRALDAATTLKARLERELAAPDDDEDRTPAAALAAPDALAAERDRLRARVAVAERAERLDDLVRHAVAPLQAEQVRRAVAGAAAAAAAAEAEAGAGRGSGDAMLLLANYCLAALWSRPAASAPTPPPLPHYYLDVEVDGAAWGRVVVQVRADVAPRMARNFSALVSGALGVGYRGCSVFQCWERESVITGDFELNNGRGGRSVYEEVRFVPDESRLPAARGAVGMRRSQKRHDNLGLVGSQFRIVLREMRGFSAIFGSVVEGLGLVERLASTGDSAGKPHASIVIADCGRLD